MGLDFADVMDVPVKDSNATQRLLQRRIQKLEKELREYHSRLLRVQKLQQVYTGFVADPLKNIHVIVESAAQLLDFPVSIYNRTCLDQKCLIPFAGYNLPQDFQTTDSPDGHICYEEIIKGGHAPAKFEDLSQSAYAASDPAVRRYGLKSYLGYPVSLDGKVMGSLCVVDTQTRSFGEQDVNIITTLATALSIEEERLETEQALKRQIALQEMLARISSAAIYVKDRTGFLDECLSIMGANLEVGGVFVWEYDPFADTMSNISEWLTEGIESKKADLQAIPVADIPWGIDTLKSGRTINFNDIEKCPEGREKDIMRMLGIKSLLILPLFIKTEFYGFIGFEEYAYNRLWTEEDIRILQTASHIIAKAIESKVAEDALIEANLALEGRVQRRTEKLEKTYLQLKQRQEELLKHKTQLEHVNRELIDANKAVTVLARNIENQKKEVEYNISQLISAKILPLIEKLATRSGSKKVRYDVDLVSGYLKELTCGFPEHNSCIMNLTETEARIAGMIRKGMTSEAIAKALHTSLNTVKTHRRNIRKKLDIQNCPINLKNFLQTDNT